MPIARELAGKDLRQDDDPRFSKRRNALRHHAALLASERGQVHDAAPAAFTHARSGDARGDEYAAQIRRHYGVPLVDLDLPYGTADRARRIVDQDVDRPRCLEHRCDGRRIGDIDADGAAA
jgi:hypothetical protein